MEMCYMRMLIHTVYTLCFGNLIVSLNTTFSHFAINKPETFTKCLVIEICFSHGKVLEVHWSTRV